MRRPKVQRKGPWLNKGATRVVNSFLKMGLVHQHGSISQLASELEWVHVTLAAPVQPAKLGAEISNRMEKLSCMSVACGLLLKSS